MTEYEIYSKAKAAQQEILNCSKNMTPLSPESAPTYYEVAARRLSNEMTLSEWKQFCKWLKK